MPVMTEYRPGQFCWVDLNAHNMDEAKKFYNGVFGWTCQDQANPDGHPYGLFFLGDKNVAGIGEMSKEMISMGIPPIWNSYVNVENCDQTVDRARSLGASIIVPSMEAGEAGTLAFIQDPTGATVGLWEKNQHFGAQQVNDPGCFSWNELVSRDIDKATKFFGELFGWTFEENKESPTKYFMIKHNGEMAGGMMQMTDDWGDVPAHWGVYFTVQNIQQTCEKIKENGGKICTEPFEISMGSLAVCSDAQGAMFNLFEKTHAE
jgi:uncharacterized protein